MKKMFLWFIILSMIAVFTLAGCKVVAEEETYIAVISKGFQHQFWQCVKLGAEKAAEDYNVNITFEGPETEDAIAEQIDMLRVAIDKNPGAICLAALDSKAVIPQLAEAEDKGIPIIGFDSGVESDIVVTTCATDSYAASALAGEKILELLDVDTGKIAILSFSQTAKSGIDRRDGFIDKIKEEAPNIEIIVEYSNGDTLKATDITKALIAGNPDIIGFFGLAANDTNGILNAVKELDMEGRVVIVGFDAGKQQIDTIPQSQPKFQS